MMKRTMKKAMSFLLSFVLCVSMMIPVYAEEGSGSASLVVNGSFEDIDWDNKTPNGWEISGTAGAIWADWKEECVAYDADCIVSAWAADAFTAGLYQQVTGLEPGKYQLSVYAQSGGGMNSCYIYGNGTGQAQRKQDVKTSNDWAENILKGIVVGDDGIAEIGFYVDANAGNWVNLDYVVLSADTSEEVPSSVPNASFEEGTWDESTYIPNSWTLEGSVSAKWSEEAYDGNYMISTYAEEAYTAKVETVVEGLEPGYYYLTAYTQMGAGDLGSDDQKVCYLYGKGSNQKTSSMTMIPRRGVESEKMEWTEITVRGIKVCEDGKAIVGLYTEGYAGNWINIDKLTLTREKNQKNSYHLLKGGDISMLTLLEDNGARFYNQNGKEGDALQILSDNGWDIARIRLYNNPGKGRGVEEYYCPEGYCNLADTLELARRAKEKGMQIQYSFHYSDYWTNAAVHLIPAEWKAAIEGKTEEETVTILETFMYTYTKEVLEKLAEQGTAPEYVSLGNEMQNGMLYPYGEATEKGWPNLARFLKAAVRAVREAAPDARIILHSDGAGDEPRYENLFGNCRRYHVDYDIIGVSYYPFWVNLSVKDVVSFCNKLVDRYDKDIILMETGFNFTDFTENGYPGQLADNGPYPYGNGASSPANQREFMAELFNGLKCVKDGRGIGDLYWDPIMVAQESIGWAMREDTDTMSVNVVSNTALFDFEHKLLPAASAYIYNQEGK